MATAKNEGLSDLKHKSSRRFRKRFKPMLHNLTEYTANTTIHGIKYLGWKKRPIIEKIYWIIIFMICLSLLVVFICQITSKWRHKFTILVEDDTPTPIHKIPFPALTICPHYKIKKSKFSYANFIRLYQQKDTNLNAYNKYLMRFHLAQQLCSFKTTASVAKQIFTKQDFLNRSHIELLHEISPKFKDIFSIFLVNKCNIKMSSLKISTTSIPITVDTFSTILTNEGICFTLNINPNIIRSENVQTDYLFLNNTGTNKGVCSARGVSRIKINLAINKSDIDSLCQSTQLGYKVILHSPEIYPSTFENYIAINHESVSRIKVQPKMITTSETLRGYTPKQRQCYFVGERQLKFFNFYNRANCKLECFTNYTLQMYGCVHFALPHSPGIPICSEPINYAEQYEMVDGFDSLITYLQDYPDNHAGIEFSHPKESYPRSCDCLSECNSIEYDYSTIVENFNFDKMVEEMNYPEMKYNSTIFNSPTEFEIFWESSKFQGTIRKQLYTFSDLISHFGGLLGLFMGASILSIFEIIYFCVVRQFTNKYWKR